MLPQVANSGSNNKQLPCKTHGILIKKSTSGAVGCSGRIAVTGVRRAATDGCFSEKIAEPAQVMSRTFLMRLAAISARHPSEELENPARPASTQHKPMTY